MYKSIASWLAGSAACAALLLPLPALAQTFNVPAAPNNGVTFVNVGVFSGKVYLNMMDNAGRCDWWMLSNSRYLQGDVVIQGSSKRDYVHIAHSTGTIWLCGIKYTMEAVNYNIHDIDIFGNDGNDSLYGSYVSGGAGNDYIEVREPLMGTWSGGGIAEGGAGDDEIRTNQGSLLRGDDSGLNTTGNDKLCAPPNVRLARIDGGPGTDYFCASNSSGSSATKNCSKCGF